MSYGQLLDLLWATAPEKTLSAGVSPAFVAAVFDANRDDEEFDEEFNEEIKELLDAEVTDPGVINTLLEWAVMEEEFGCPTCGDYCTLEAAPVDKDGYPRCPNCGEILESPVCVCCGAPLNTLEGYQGKQFHGFYLCPKCFEEAEERKRIIESVSK